MRPRGRSCENSFLPLLRSEAARERFEHRAQFRIADVAQAVPELHRDRLERRWPRNALGANAITTRRLNLALPQLDPRHRLVAEEAVHPLDDLGDHMLDQR